MVLKISKQSPNKVKTKSEHSHKNPNKGRTKSENANRISEQRQNKSRAMSEQAENSIETRSKQGQNKVKTRSGQISSCHASIIEILVLVLLVPLSSIIRKTVEFRGLLLFKHAKCLQFQAP
jgi:cobalamin biosynthesis Mg chelatase CobN